MSVLFNVGTVRYADFCAIKNNFNMKAYGIFDVRSITDAQGMEQYREAVIDTVDHFGGRYVAIGGPLEVLEGTVAPVFPVIIEFPDMDSAKAWYTSPQYAGLKALRHRSAQTQAYLLRSIVQ